ncbi:hypothetical protein [Dysgonomonas sp.]
MDKPVIQAKQMATYPENVMQVLQANGISCSCDKSKRLVYVLYEGHFGEIYSIYCEGNRGSIDNFTLYPFSVPDGRREEVEQCLAKINGPDSAMGFYIDTETGCIAFYSRYRKALDAGGDAEGITSFCMETHKACLKHQISLYVLTGGRKGKG